jgi:penicillin-binding protein-related factor A (putative recombinase)
MNENRRFAGKRAKIHGDVFEKYFEQTCEIQGVECVRIPNGCRSLGAFKLVRVPTPFDYVLCYNQRSAFVDLKSIESGNLTYSKLTPHQLESLKRLSPGGVSGYVVNFSGEVYFIDISILLETKKGESVSLDYAKHLGHRTCMDIRRIF